MALASVPWFTSGGVNGAGGAENKTELARAAVYIGSSGATGIVDPDDGLVRELPTPGPYVRVPQLTGVIKSTYPGVQGQSYVVREDSSTDVPVTATGSSGGATKYVYIQIDDTQYNGQAPASVKDGPYCSYQVTTTLPTFTPYLLLAIINQPASTATITNSMIQDARKVANPLVEDVWRFKAMVNENTETLTATGAVGEYFPNAGGPQSILIPEWATRAKIEVGWLQVRYEPGNAWGQVWVEYGPYSGPSQRERKTQALQWDTGSETSTHRGRWDAVDDVYIPKSYRGTTQLFVPKARQLGGATSVASMDGISGMSMKVRFEQVADPSTT